MMSPTDLLILYFLHALLFGFIAFAVICRIDTMHRKRNKLSWWFMYAAYAAFSFAALIDVLVHKEWQPVYLLGLLGVALNLWLTHKSWPGGKPPPLSCKPGCAP